MLNARRGLRLTDETARGRSFPTIGRDDASNLNVREMTLRSLSPFPSSLFFLSFAIG